MSAAKGRWVHVPGEPKPKETAMNTAKTPWKAIFIALTIGIVLGYLFCDVRADAIKSSGRSSAHGQVNRLLREQQEAWNKGDIDGFLSAYEMSKDITFYSDDVIEPGWVALRDRFTKSYVTNKKPMGQLEFTDNEYSVFPGEAVIVRGRWTLNLGDGKTRGGLFTILVKKTDTGWKIVHDHTSERKASPER